MANYYPLSVVITGGCLSQKHCFYLNPKPDKKSLPPSLTASPCTTMVVLPLRKKKLRNYRHKAQL